MKSLGSQAEVYRMERCLDICKTHRPKDVAKDTRASSWKMTCHVEAMGKDPGSWDRVNQREGCRVQLGDRDLMSYWPLTVGLGACGCSFQNAMGKSYGNECRKIISADLIFKLYLKRKTCYYPKF